MPTTALDLPDDLPAHGGDLADAARRFGPPPAAGWLDLSTGLNPRPYPVPPLPAECWARLPGRDDALRAAAARYYGVAGQKECVVCAAGSQPILQALPHVLPPAPVAVVGPTYGELSAVWWNAGRQVEIVPSLEDAERAGAAIVVLANPNNPDGREHAPERLADLAERLHQQGGGCLIVDEAFADIRPELSVAPRVATGLPGLLVLRSFGKFFGLAGLRLGFALAAPPLAASLRRALGPWPVGGPALRIGEAALLDDRWVAAARDRLAADRGALDLVLAGAGLTPIGGCDLFRLVRTPHAAALHAHLGRHGILVRIFADRPDLVRIGLPGSGERLSRLAEALAAFSAR
jgi:cobalamin biosynthetic protein CobC